MPRRSSRTVWLGKVSFADRRHAQLVLLHELFPDALVRALDPDKRVRYLWKRRTDRLGTSGPFGLSPR
jgi:hypothetical protein